MSDREIDRSFLRGDYDGSVRRLEEGLKRQGEDGDDLLLYLLDLGLVLHTAGKYEESNQYFLRADQIADIKDYTSLADETATLLTSDNIKAYKGEDFEKVLINTYLAMNFALLGEYDEALVEARRVNRKLYLMITDGQRKYKQNAFARYLSGILYEAQGEHNDAYIDYKETWKLQPDMPGLCRDLWRMARFLDMTDQMEKWDEECKLTKEDHEAALALHPRRGKGEIIVLYENGISPIKKPHPSFYSIPKFYPRFNPVSSARIEVDGQLVGVTAVLHNIEWTAIENLDEKYAGIIARKVAGIAAKEVVAHQIGKNTHPALGQLARIALYVSDQADLRSWNLLPKDLQILRIPVEPGTHTVRALPFGSGPLGERTVQVQAGKKVFVAFRYTPEF